MGSGSSSPATAKNRKFHYGRSSTRAGRVQFEVTPESDDTRALVTQTVFFEPKGLGGTLYWNVVRPLHGLLFAGRLRALRQWIEQPDPERMDASAQSS